MSWDYNATLPSWYLNGLVRSVDPNGPLATGAVTIEPLRTVGAKVYQSRRPSASVYLDVIESVALLFNCGLEACGLAYQIMMNEPFALLRSNCHSRITDEVLRETVLCLHAHLITKDCDIPNALVLTGNEPFMEFSRRHTRQLMQLNNGRVQ